MGMGCFGRISSNCLFVGAWTLVHEKNITATEVTAPRSMDFSP